MNRHPLEALLRPTWPVQLEDGNAVPEVEGRVACRTDGGPRRWLRSGDWQIYASSASRCDARGDVIDTFVRDGGATLAAFQDASTGEVTIPFSLADAYGSYVSERWREASANRRLSERTLRLFYRVKSAVPRRVQLAARRRLIARQGIPDFPSWPVDASVGRRWHFE